MGAAGPHCASRGTPPDHAGLGPYGRDDSHCPEVPFCIVLTLREPRPDVNAEGGLSPGVRASSCFRHSLAPRHVAEARNQDARQAAACPAPLAYHGVCPACASASSFFTMLQIKSLFFLGQTLP